MQDVIAFAERPSRLVSARERDCVLPVANDCSVGEANLWVEHEIEDHSKNNRELVAPASLRVNRDSRNMTQNAAFLSHRRMDYWRLHGDPRCIRDEKCRNDGRQNRDGAQAVTDQTQAFPIGHSRRDSGRGSGRRCSPRHSTFSIKPQPQHTNTSVRGWKALRSILRSIIG
jgi:hypothetical protein